MEALSYIGRDQDGKGTAWVTLKDDEGNEVLVGIAGGEVRVSYLDEELTWKELFRKKVGQPEVEQAMETPPPPPAAAPGATPAVVHPVPPQRGSPQ